MDIRWLDAPDDGDVLAAAGPKIGRLAQLAAAGLTVPSGFAVTTEAFRRHCAQNRLPDAVDELLDGADPGDAAQVEAAAARIREAFAAARTEPELEDAIAAAYEELCDRTLQVNVPVAVRSSAAGEDAADVSFAGAFDTYLGVSGGERVVESVRACWASLFSPRAVAYRLRHGIDHRDTAMAVGVVELVAARSSGVAFSVHPVSGRPDRIVVEANWGWGQAVVQGLVTPDHLEIDKADRRVLRHDVASKRLVSTFDFAVGRVRELPMPQRLRDRRVLDGEEVERIADAVLRIEQWHGAPVDVEWVIDRSRRPGEPVTVVQARPVTTSTAVHHGWNPADYAARYAFGDTF